MGDVAGDVDQTTVAVSPQRDELPGAVSPTLARQEDTGAHSGHSPGPASCLSVGDNGKIQGKAGQDTP